MLGEVENRDDVGKGIVSYGRDLSRSAPHWKNNPNGVGAWFITFRIHETMMNDDSNKNNRQSHAQHHAMDRTQWA